MERARHRNLTFVLTPENASAVADLYRRLAGIRDSVASGLRRTLGIPVAEQGNGERAIRLFEESLALSRGVRNGRGAAISFLCLGQTWRNWSDLHQAMEVYEVGLELCREAGDPALLASFLTHLGYTFLLQGDLERTAISHPRV